MADVFRYSACSSDGTFLTAKEGLLPPKYDFAIDLTCDDSETKYSSPCSESVLRNCIAKLLRAKNAYLAR